MHVSHVIWQRAQQAKVMMIFSLFFLVKSKDPIFISRMCWVDVWMCTCFPSMADFISLKVVWNSPMKSCFPLESQSHTVHYNKNRRKNKKQETTTKTVWLRMYASISLSINIKATMIQLWAFFTYAYTKATWHNVKNDRLWRVRI